MGCVIVHIAASVIGTQIGLRLFLILGCDHGSKNAVVMQTFFSYKRGRAGRGEVLVIVAHHVCVILLCIFDVRNRLDHFFFWAYCMYLIVAGWRRKTLTRSWAYVGRERWREKYKPAMSTNKVGYFTDLMKTHFCLSNWLP